VTWQEAIAVVVILAGLGGGAFLVAQRPTFWIEFGARLFKAVLPRIVGYVTKRMPENQERAWRECERRGGRWNHRTRKCDR
jgi:hypothetical protein